MNKFERFQLVLGAMVFGGLGIALAAILADRLWRYFEEKR